MIRSCRGNCCLARADALDEHSCLGHGRMLLNDGSENSQALVKGRCPNVHEERSRIHYFRKLLRCHSLNLGMGACGDQTVSHAAGAQKLVAESHFQGKASIAKA